MSIAHRRLANLQVIARTIKVRETLSRFLHVEIDKLDRIAVLSTIVRSVQTAVDIVQVEIVTRYSQCRSPVDN